MQHTKCQCQGHQVWTTAGTVQSDTDITGPAEIKKTSAPAEVAVGTDDVVQSDVVTTIPVQDNAVTTGPVQSDADTTGPVQSDADTTGSSTTVIISPVQSDADTTASSTTVTTDPVQSHADTTGSSTTVTTDPVQSDADTTGSSTTVTTDPVQSDADTTGSSTTVVIGPVQSDADTTGSSTTVTTDWPCPEWGWCHWLIYNSRHWSCHKWGCSWGERGIDPGNIGSHERQRRLFRRNKRYLQLVHLLVTSVTSWIFLRTQVGILINISNTSACIRTPMYYFQHIAAWKMPTSPSK